jgi:hypothetical protein
MSNLVDAPLQLAIQKQHRALSIAGYSCIHARHHRLPYGALLTRPLEESGFEPLVPLTLNPTNAGERDEKKRSSSC